MSNKPAYIDRFDEEVVKRMEVGETYGATKVRNAYKAYTTINNDETAKSRQMALFQSPCMEFTGRIGFYKFVGLQEADVL